MQEAVSSILIGRSREADGLSRMVLISLAIHGVLLVALVIVPRDWLRMQTEEEATPMMISLGPSGTADTGGMTAITARPVQQESAETKPVNAPPAPKVPEMVAPAPDVKPKPVTKPIEKPVEKSSTRKPSTGAEVKSGAARVETPNASQVPFGGLAERAGATQRRRASTRRRQLLLSRVRRYDEPAHPLELGSEAGGGRADDREVHDSPRRRAGQRRGREDERQPAARSGIEAGRASTRGSCLPFRLSSTDRR